MDTLNVNVVTCGFGDNMIGIGIGIDFEYRRRFSSADVTSGLVSIFGADLVGDWCFDDATLDGSSNATALPGRLASTDLFLSGPRVIPTTTINGRRFSHVTTTTGRSLKLNAAWAAKQIIMVANVTLPFANSGWAVSSYDIGEVMVANIGAASDLWYADGGWVHKIDGTASETLLAGLHIYGASKAAPTHTGIGLCGAGTTYVNSDFLGDIGRVIAVTSVATTQQLADASTLLRRYYGF